MAKQEECTKCKNVKVDNHFKEIHCSYYGRTPQIDNQPCSHFSGGQQVDDQSSSHFSSNIQRCPKCGQEIPNTSSTCLNCGYRLQENTTSSFSRPPKSRITSDSPNTKFVSENLTPEEKILYSAEWHWINYVKMALLGTIPLAFLLLWIYGIGCLISASNLEHFYEQYRNYSYSGGPGPELVWGLYLPCFILSAIIWVYGLFAIKHNEFVVTNKRIIIKSGIIIRASYELRLEMLESIQVYQGILGRILGFGSILVHGVGASRQAVMWIKSPLEFRQHIFEELSKKSIK